MVTDKTRTQEVDLDRTDRLPILDGSAFDEDVGDDAVRLEYSPAVPSVKGEFQRPSSVDLPSLAESVRSVEERIVRQSADYETLNRTYEKAREAEAAATARAKSLETDIAGLRANVESEQARSRALDMTLAKKTEAAEAARSRLEESLREAERQRANSLGEAERHRSESRTLKETLTARESAIADALHKLGERDAQLNSLQREHARMAPILEQQTVAAGQLESELRAVRLRSEELAEELRGARQSVGNLQVKMKSGDDELGVSRRELDGLKSQLGSYLEVLQSREWRRGFDENLFRDLDAKIGAARGDQGALEAERDRLRQRVTDLEAKLALRDETIGKLNIARTDTEAVLAQHERKLTADEAARTELAGRITAIETERTRLRDELLRRDETIGSLQMAAEADRTSRTAQEVKLQEAERACADLRTNIAAVELERDRLNGELSKRDGAVAEALLARRSEQERSKSSLAAAEKAQTELQANFEQLRVESRAREQEMEVLVAHLQQARRPIETIEAEVKRLTEELAAKVQSIEQLNEDNRGVRASLERTRGALEEREFLIRRLERSESNNANVLGRIQTSIERLGTPGVTAGSAAAALEPTAELIRIDGNAGTTHSLGRRTRIGRAPGCEMQIESSSVSRHHALLLASPRDVIIEDLNSTNGVLVNGRKVSRQLLHDGDLLTIGEAQFRLNVKFAGRVLESPASGDGLAASEASRSALPASSEAQRLARPGVSDSQRVALPGVAEPPRTGPSPTEPK